MSSKNSRECGWHVVISFGNFPRWDENMCIVYAAVRTVPMAGIANVIGDQL